MPLLLISDATPAEQARELRRAGLRGPFYLHAHCGLAYISGPKETCPHCGTRTSGDPYPLPQEQNECHAEQPTNGR